MQANLGHYFGASYAHWVPCKAPYDQSSASSGTDPLVGHRRLTHQAAQLPQWLAPRKKGYTLRDLQHCGVHSCLVVQLRWKTLAAGAVALQGHQATVCQRLTKLSNVGGLLS